MPILGIIASQDYPRSTNSYESIQTYTVGGAGSSNISFTSIPATYTHLQIRGICTTTRNSNDGNVAKLRFNNDTGSNYYTTHGMGSSGLALIATASGQFTSIYLERTANTVNSNVFSAVILDILDYSLTTKNKAIRALMGYEINAASNTYNLNYQSGLWMSTSAITQIDLFPDTGNFAQYTQFALYGIKGA